MVSAKKEVIQMSSYSPPLEGRAGKLRLDFNENTAGCSPKVIEAISKIDCNFLSAYPEYTQFYTKLAKYLKVLPENLCLFNGTDEAIKLVIETFLQKGDSIAIPSPTYAMYKFYSQLNGLKIIQIPYKQGLAFPAETVLCALSNKPKLLVLVNPNSPTGTEISDSDIQKMLKKAKENGVLVAIDEAYSQYFKKSSISKIKECENLIVIQTFSKAFGLAALRIGYAVSNEDIISSLRKANSPYSVNSVAIIAASAALNDLEYVEKYANEIIENRKYMKLGLEQLGFTVYPSSANFLLVNFGAKNNLICKKLSQNNILIRNRNSEPMLENCSRVGVGTKAQCEQFLSTLKKIISQPLLIFDMDGVLVDVSNSYRKAIQQTVLFFCKKEPTPDEIQQYKQRGGLNSDWDLTEEIIKDNGKTISKEKIIKKFQQYYIGEGSTPGLIENEKWLLNAELLQSLSKNYALAIFTGRPKKEALYTLQKNNAAEYFDLVLAMGDIPKEKSKPNPYGLTLCLKILGYNASNAYYFGDSIDDMQAAKNAKVEAIGIISPNICEPGKLSSLLKEKGASVVLNDINDILGVLG
ncbi:MAG: histidinol-phosphate transaminase [Candidatus Micrarchaeota archaeon]